jgi:hypothetical protein
MTSKLRVGNLRGLRHRFALIPVAALIVAAAALSVAMPATGATNKVGTLKVCKVAGFEIPVGTPFTFTAGSVTVVVPAGPAPGGYCNIVGTYPVGTDVSIKETIPGGDEVEGISVLPAAQLVSSTIATGKVKVDVGTGVTEVTYTDQSEEAAKAGYLEICKQATAGPVAPPTSFQFTVDGQQVTVPTNACTSAIQLPSGSTVVTETPAGGYSMSACAAIPAADLVSCNPSGNTATVKIVAGNTSTQTILEVTNSPATGG